MKNLKKYLALSYRTALYKDEDGDYIAEIGDLQGCVAHGPTPSAALKSLDEAKKVWMESRLAAGLEIPEPKRIEDYSGKLLVRMPRHLHQRLSEQAIVEGVSLNQHLVALLSEAMGRVE
jgi:antitoxin HicB